MVRYFLQTEKIRPDLQIEGVFWDHSGWPGKFSPQVSLFRRAAPLSNSKAHAGKYQPTPARAFH